MAIIGMYGPQAILSTAGIPAKNTPVTVYKANTTTVATLYTKQTGTTVGPNPLNTDAYGNLKFFAAPGIYTLSFTVGGVATTLQVEVLPYFTTLERPLGKVFATSQICTFATAGQHQVTGWPSGNTVLLGGMTAPSNNFVVPVAGAYAASAAMVLQVAGNPVPATHRWRLQIRHNGTKIAQIGTPSMKTMATFLGIPSIEVTCAANDTFQLWFTTDYTGNIGLGWNATNPVYFNVWRVA